MAGPSRGESQDVSLSHLCQDIVADDVGSSSTLTLMMLS
jgi:hypothetical protein